MPAKRRVLVVEDDQDGLESSAEFLDAMGYHACSASTGDVAIALVAAWAPDVVMMDLGVEGGDMDGIALAKAIKRLPLPRPFVIAYTGWPRREAEARAAGCDAFVAKPDIDGLLAALEAAPQLGRRKASANDA